MESFGRNVAAQPNRIDGSERGYDAGSEATSGPVAPNGRRRSRSRRRHAQQAKQNMFIRVSRKRRQNNRMRRWRRKAAFRQLNGQQVDGGQFDSNQKLEASNNTASSAAEQGQSSSCAQKSNEQDLNSNIENSTPCVSDVNNESLITNTKCRKVTFQCQLAHGSPTGIIVGFNNIRQLYQAIADCYDNFSAEDILFCTVNTHKISMDALLASTISLNDFIFAHIVGQKKEITIKKTESSLGLTITDNGAGKAFIKRIRDGSVSSRAKPALEIGNFIEQINDDSMVGKRHFDVARYLRNLPVGCTFKMRLIAPKKSAFDAIGSRTTRTTKKTNLLDGTQTLRFKADGSMIIQEAPNAVMIERINEIFDAYLGLHDDDMAQTIFELAAQCDTFDGLQDGVRKSEMGQFDFPRELIFDLWGVVDDFKCGRLDQKVLLPTDPTGKSDQKLKELN